MGLALEILGLIVLLGVHVFVTMRDRRAALVSRIGEWPYRGLFSLASIVGILLIAYGFAAYRAAGMITVWNPPAWTGNIKRVLKHPMLAGVKTWAFAHLCANGDLGGMILFGSVLAWAVYDRITLKHRTDPGGPPIPIGGTRNDIIAIVVGTIIYLALGFVFHPVVVGVPAFGTPA